MKLPIIKKILKEDLKDAPLWVNGLIGPLNQFMESVYNVLNRNITFTENINSFVFELTYKTNLAYFGLSISSLTDVFASSDMSHPSQFKKIEHGLLTGQIVRLTTTGVLPSPLTTFVDYYVIKIDDDYFQLASSPAIASSSTEIALVNVGTGNQIVTSEIPTSFKNQLKVRATGVLVGRAIESSTYIPAPGPVYISWVEDLGQIKIRNITGLEPDKTYSISLLII